MTSVVTRGFVVTGSEDGGPVAALRICARVVDFHVYTFGKCV